MLKVKDNVDLKELEKFGLKLHEETGRYEYIKRNCGGETYIFINSWNKKILFVQRKNYDDICLGILYDLIQAGLVEKE